MKKLLIISALILSINSASAADGYYIGAEATANKLNYRKSANIATGSFSIHSNDYYNNNAYGFGIFAGKQFNFSQRFDVELGFNSLSNSKSNHNTGLVVVSNNAPLSTKSEVRVNMISLDFKPHARINERLSVVPLVGLTFANAKITERFYGAGAEILSISERKNKLGFDVGVGVKYQINEHIFTRIQAKYTRLAIKTNETAGIRGLDYIATASIGIGYNF